MFSSSMTRVVPVLGTMNLVQYNRLGCVPGLVTTSQEWVADNTLHF